MIICRSWWHSCMVELHLKTKVSEIRKCVFRRLAQASTAHLEKSFRYILPFGIWAAAHPTPHHTLQVMFSATSAQVRWVGQQYVASLLQFCPKFSPGNLFSGSAAGWATKSTYAAAILQSLHRVYTLHSICWQCWRCWKLLTVLTILKIVDNVHHCWQFEIGRKCLKCGRRRQFQNKHFEISCLYLGSSRL